MSTIAASASGSTHSPRYNIASIAATSAGVV